MADQTHCLWEIPRQPVWSCVCACASHRSWTCSALPAKAEWGYYACANVLSELPDGDGKPSEAATGRVWVSSVSIASTYYIWEPCVRFWAQSQGKRLKKVTKDQTRQYKILSLQWTESSWRGWYFPLTNNRASQICRVSMLQRHQTLHSNNRLHRECPLLLVHGPSFE